MNNRARDNAILFSFFMGSMVIILIVMSSCTRYAEAERLVRPAPLPTDIIYNTGSSPVAQPNQLRLDRDEKRQVERFAWEQMVEDWSPW